MQKQRHVPHCPEEIHTPAAHERYYGRKKMLIVWQLILLVSLVVPLQAQVLHLLKDLAPGDGSSNGGALFAELGGRYYYNGDLGSNHKELCVTDGTESGTSLFVDINPSGSSNPGPFYKMGNKLFFPAFHASYGVELWVTDGTVAGTHMVKDIIAHAVKFCALSKS